jgi:peptide/nickel transport system permease protein
MILYVVRRVLVSIPLLLVASFLSFALIMKMGDPLADWKLSAPRSKGQIAAAEHRIGMDRPFLERYGDWTVSFMRGDWGTTVIPGNGTKDVRREIMRAAPISVRLVLAAEIMALLVGVASASSVRCASTRSATTPPPVRHS